MSTGTDSPRARRLGPIIGLLPYVIGGGIVGALGAHYGMLLGTTMGMSAWHLLLLPVAFYLSIIVHEAGHFVAGRLAGLQWLIVAVGPLRLTRRRQRVEVEWFRNRGSIGGLVVMLPGQAKVRTLSWVLYGLGGPLANLLLALLVGLLAMPLATGAWQGSLLVLAAVSALLGLVNLLPFQAGGMSTDGRNILQILRGHPGFEMGQVMLSLSSQSYSGVRPRDWDPLLVEALEHMIEPPTEIRAAREFLLYLRALDAGLHDTARQRLAGVEAAFEHVPEPLAPPIACAVSVHHALVEPDPERAREWHARGAHGLGDATLSAMADLGLAVLEERGDDAARIAARARAAMAEDADQGGIQPYRDLLERLPVPGSAAEESPRP